ncbi:hypothetical protein E5288_WYG014626 [Bos mutus]|uniref:Uncharacterized protein n=1 Tax=Bos mutus TaxID=72004 RepID=A0A6B0R3I6_9CETA|nr:hypothetical protein [Bos mutus]
MELQAGTGCLQWEYPSSCIGLGLEKLSVSSCRLKEAQTSREGEQGMDKNVCPLRGLSLEPLPGGGTPDTSHSHAPFAFENISVHSQFPIFNYDKFYADINSKLLKTVFHYWFFIPKVIYNYILSTNIKGNHLNEVLSTLTICLSQNEIVFKDFIKKWLFAEVMFCP